METKVDELGLVFDRIRTASKRLNKAGDKATDEIEALEKRLVDAEPGVAAWGPTILTEESEYLDDETGASEPVQRRVTVGFGRRKKKWGFMVREELWGKKRPEDSDWTVSVSQETFPLRKADRDVRVLALPHLRSVAESVLAELERRTTQLFGEKDRTESEADGAITADTSIPPATNENAVSAV